MLISHDNKFIFLKTPKTAGTSTELLFQPFCTPVGFKVTHATDVIETTHGVVGWRGPRLAPGRDQAKWFNHQNAEQIKQLLGWRTWRKYLKFANIRNPFTRAISHFAFLKAHTGEQEGGNFSDFLDQFDAYLFSKNYSTYQRQLMIGKRWALDDVIRRECIARDISRIALRLGLDVSDAVLTHKKKRVGGFSKRPASDYFNQARTDQVLNTEGWCFDQFGYSEDPRETGVTP